MSDLAHMQAALRLARRGLGLCWPNPAVGCVIVKEGRVIGRGATAPFGRPHAEPQALAAAGAEARGASVYVTLEPCAHHGKTPPCTEALIAAGVARVISALEDPDPRVQGRGHALLRAAGIAVEVGLGAEEAAEINAGFLKRQREGLPFVTLKWGASLDGRIAHASGESRWITGPLARAQGQALRRRHDAVLVGAGTAVQDDPALTLRGYGAPPLRPPLRLLLDRALTHAPESALGQGIAEAPLWVLHGPEAAPVRAAAWAARGARLIPVPLKGAHLDLRAAFVLLATEGLTRILVEAGPGLSAALVQAGLVDEIALFTAGKLLGGDALPALGPLALSGLAAAPAFARIESTSLGGDIFSRWRPLPMAG